MYKVSFKKGAKSVEVFNDKITIVTLQGTIAKPKWFWNSTPYDVGDWILNHPTVKFDDFGLDKILVVVSGKSKCANEDSFNPVIGERIAESRAKIRLYKFMHTFMCKMYQYHFGKALGDKYSGKCVEAEYNSKDGGFFEEMHKYQALLIKESYHLGKLLEEA